MQNTDEAASPNYWLEHFERIYGTKLRHLVNQPLLLASDRELTKIREELRDALRTLPMSVKDGKIGPYAYDYQAIGNWVVSLPKAAFPPLSVKVAALYGIDETLRRERLARNT